ncbi:ATP-binding cassette domain-containing protein [Methanospirillum hungatei]|jgi:cobalt/nickel transport system ATP-binding protein|uniref:ATP-binding cassette domain-containing protein n=1 Tax=Methanospirillum hungatei TaxID=2203 RepID=UPI001B599E2B|nr:ATP-binding cassette domain-containing protein [Methanospirillum hungatei]MBP7035114.1 ATP-binding cassette domain-containing protein [Methanospirillum sp.]HOW04373.1 ATP-binding cassette domain-containing protein [Methanospirillum hungatei]
MHIIETQDLCHTYKGNIDALKNISFIAPRNTRIAIIGPNGAGKSTLFKHFNGVLKPTSGKVLIRGEPITKENIREVRRTVGLVFQNPDDQIFSPTVEQDVAFGPINMGLDEEAVKHRVSEALRTVGLSEYRTRVPHHLSGGEKKRVAIAGIIAMEPQVLVLDEPTAGLDPQGVREIIRFIRDFSVRYGMTVIFSTHNISLVAELAEYIYVMNNGSFVAEGTVAEIFSQPDLLSSVRLDLPILPKLISSLRSKGIAIDMGYTYQEAETAFLKAFGKIA